MKQKLKPSFQKAIVELPPRFRFLRKAAIHSFQLPGGASGRWESLFDEGHTVLVAALTPEKSLVLVELFRFPCERRYLELPGGDAGDGENLEAAARRELWEETGYTTKQPFKKLGGGPIFNGKVNSQFTVFAAFDCEKTGKPKLDPVEKIAGLRVVIKDPKQILSEIASGSENYDPILGHALLALMAKGIISTP